MEQFPVRWTQVTKLNTVVIALPPDKTQGNILALFPEEPTAIVMLNKAQQRHQSRAQQERKVIKFVPHPPTSATESTARIMGSVWEERIQVD